MKDIAMIAYTHLHDVRVNVISYIVALPDFRDLILLLILVHQIPIFFKIDN